MSMLGGLGRMTIASDWAPFSKHSIHGAGIPFIKDMQTHDLSRCHCPGSRKQGPRGRLRSSCALSCREA